MFSSQLFSTFNIKLAEGEDCDVEIRNLICSNECEDDDDDEDYDEEVADEVEPEIEAAAQLTAEDMTKLPSELMCRLKITSDDCRCNFILLEFEKRNKMISNCKRVSKQQNNWDS